MCVGEWEWDGGGKERGSGVCKKWGVVLVEQIVGYHDGKHYEMCKLDSNKNWDRYCLSSMSTVN